MLVIDKVRYYFVVSVNFPTAAAVELLHSSSKKRKKN